MSTPNFLHQPSTAEQSRPTTTPPAAPLIPEQPKKRRRIWPWITAVVIMAVLCVTVPPAIAVVRAASAASNAKAALLRARDHAAALDMVSVGLDISEARADIDLARSLLQGVGFWRQMPFVGVQIRGIEDAAAAGSGTLDAVGDLARVFSSLTEAMNGGAQAVGGLNTGIAPTRRFQDLTTDEKRDVLRTLERALPDVRVARDKIDLALELWNRVPQNELISPIRNALQPLADALPAMQKSLDAAAPLLEVGLPLAGADHPEHALVLLQNADELRPAGGFIGTLGAVTADAGDLRQFDFFDVYKIDGAVSSSWKEVPPPTLAKQLGVNAWYLRDANWSPDFPTSAEQVLKSYTGELSQITNAPVADAPSTVIALEPGFFSALLKLTGPITVDGTMYDAETFYDKIEYDVEVGFAKDNISVAQRKELMGHIGAALVDRLRALPAARWSDLFATITTSLNQKQIQIYSRESDVLAAADRYGWSGRAQGTTQDFVWVVDANLAALKTDGVMKKAVSYQLDATNPAEAKATVTLTYENANRVIDWRHTRYRSYTRVYVPEGSELISSAGAMKDDLHNTGGVFVAGTVDVTKELGKTVFGAFWSVEPGKTGTLSFTYKLPSAVGEKIAQGTYRLDWPKQAGADKTQLTVQALFGKNVLSAVPPEPKEKWGDARYEVQTDTAKDRVFLLQLSK
jgi:hypothetical protein